MEGKRTLRFRRALRCLPEGLRQRAEQADGEKVEELRLRCGHQLSAVYFTGEQTLGGREVTPSDIGQLVMAAAKGSVYAAGESIRRGYITLDGGHRIGICGTAVIKDGEVSNLTSFSGASIRFAHEVKGAADGLTAAISESFGSTLIIGPPGIGKTTVLRDLVRQLSDKHGLRVGLVDERWEVAACSLGEPGLDVGAKTDVLNGCPKAEGMLMLLRSMSPQVIAVDEITAPEDVAAMELCCGCGVAIIATAHGSSLKELRRRPLYRSLVDKGVFQNFALISSDRSIEFERGEGFC